MSDTVTYVKAYQWYAWGLCRDVADSKLFDDFEPYTDNLVARVSSPLRCRSASGAMSTEVIAAVPISIPTPECGATGTGSQSPTSTPSRSTADPMRR